MNAPPGSARTSQAATSRTGERTSGFLSPRVVAREAAKILAARGIDVRPVLVRRLVTRFIQEGHTTLRDLEPFVLSYADPTGETAVRNVAREERHR